jgi:HEAT repeat protein
MFNELLDLSVPRDEAIRIAKMYLSHPEPFIRYGAANTLYKIGDRSGATTLIELVLAPERIAIPGVETELRAWAANTLATHREMRAADAVAALYFATKDSDVRTFAATLGAQQIIPDLLADLKFGRASLRQLADLGVEEAKPVIVTQFERATNSTGMRVSAAGAMLRFGENEPYISYLIEVADQYAAGTLVGDSQVHFAGEDALRNMGLVHSDTTRELLERALDSKNSHVVELALIQLRVKYPESAKAREHLLQSFTGQSKLDATVRYRLAAMSNDAQIRKAAAERNRAIWQRAALHERQWDWNPWLRRAGAMRD